MSAVIATAGDAHSAILIGVCDMVAFSKSRLSVQKWFLLMQLWSRDCPVTYPTISILQRCIYAPGD